MRRKNIIIGTVGFAALSALIAINPFHFGKGNGSYNPEDLSVFRKQSAGDAQIWLAARYIDLETGKKITSEKLHMLMEQEKNRKRAGITFEELGPDNIGGRTRAIQIDIKNPQKIWAGGVSGGLFVSTDGANNWNRVDDFPGVPYISSMTQTADQTLFVGTGSAFEGWDGDGLHYLENGSSTWKVVPGTSGFFNITQVSAPVAGNTVFFATNNGLKKWTVGDASITSLTTTSGGCYSMEISRDGQVIVANAGASGKTYVSNDGGNNFTDVSGSGAGKIPNGASRIEYAISPTKNAQGKYTIYASRTASNLLGMNISLDNGMTWSQFIGASDGGSLNIYRDQGTYNTILSVDPSNTERLLIGGIDIWEWEQTANNPPSGGFDQLSQWFLDPTSDKYVHADNHEMKWDQNNRFYMGNDGGIGISTDFGATFYPANRGYNVTQFYGIAADPHGAILGGTQDNGTLYNDHTLFGYKNFREVKNEGGDGFECEISFYNPNVQIVSSYNNSIRRSYDRGFSFSTFNPNYPASYGTTGEQGGMFPFTTQLALFEYLDPNSEDSLVFMPKKNYDAGDKIRVASMATGDTIDYTALKDLYYDDTVFYDPSLTVTDYIVKNQITGGNVDLGQTGYTQTYNAAGATSPVDVGDSLLLDNGSKVLVETVTPYQHYFASSPDPSSNAVFDLGMEQQGYNVSWDTVMVADPYQSWYFVYTYANGGEIWATRDALRFAVDAKWVLLTDGLGSSNMDIELSKDLNKCYVTCGSKVYRIDGLGSIYSQASNFESAVQTAGAAKMAISNLSCEGLALNPNNANDLVIIQSGFGGSILRSANAAGASPTFSSIGNLGVACYDAVISSINSDVIVVGSAFGVYVTETGGGTAADWTTASAGFENVPVYQVRQNWRTWAEGCYRPGEIYLGTYGRGIWASSSYLSTPGQDNPYADKIKTDLKVYPNPTSDVSVLSFNLVNSGTVHVRVYNIAGQEVKSMELKNLSKGEHTVDIDAAGLRTGSYIVKFQAGKVNETVKFMKI